MGRAYHPLNLKDALRIRSTEQTSVLAGGTDWMIRQKRLLSEGCSVLYIGQLEELRRIAGDDETLHIGAVCTLSDLLSSPLVPEYLKKPLAEMASPAIRNIATIGGNVCNASPAADTLPMLYALDADICLRSAEGEEIVPVQDFILGPGRTKLDKNQILTSIRIPVQYEWACTYKKLGMRRANSLSKLSFYAIAVHADACLHDVRITFGAVAPTVVRCREAERKILSGNNDAKDDVIQRVSALYDELLQPIDDVRSNSKYRRTVSLRLLEQYLIEEMNL